MSRRLQKYRRGLAALVAGTLLFNPSSCLPKDYFYNLAGATRTVVLDTFGMVLIDGIIDRIFPGLEDDNGDDNGDTTTQ